MLEIYTNGDMAFLEAILTGLGHVYEGGYLGQIFAMALLLNVLLGFSRFIVDSKSGLLTNFWQALVLYLVFFSATTHVSLVKIGEGSRAIAGEFPIGIIAPASYISLIGNKIAERMRENIVPVNFGYGYSTLNPILQYGIEPLEALVRMRNQRITGRFEKSDLLSDPDDPSNANSGLSQSIGAYYKACVEKAVRLSDIDPTGERYKSLIKSAPLANNYWSNLKIDEPGWPVTITLDGHRSTTNCATAHDDIASVLALRAKNVSSSAVGEGLSTSNSSQSIADRLTNMNDFLAQIDPAAGTAAVMNITSNLYVSLMTQGQCKDSVLMGPEFVMACAAQFDAIQSRRFAEASKAESFKEMVVPFMTFVEGFVYMLSPFMMIAVLLLGAAGLKMLGKYLTALLWIVLIPVCQVAVDVYLNTYFNRWYHSVYRADSAGTSFTSIQAQESVWTELESFIAFAGTAQAMVPALAMFIIFAGVHTMQGLAGSASAGAAVNPATMHSNKALAIKDGTASSGAFSIVEGRGEGGASIGGRAITASTGSVDSSATDSTFKAGDSAGFASMRARQQSAMNQYTLQSSQANQNVAQEVYAGKTGYSHLGAVASGMKEEDAQRLAIASAYKDVYNLTDKQTETLAQSLTFDAGGRLSADATASIGKQFGTSTKDADGNTTSNGTGAKAGVGVAASGGVKTAIGNNTTGTEDMSRGQMAENAANLAKSRSIATTEAFENRDAILKDASLTNQSSESWQKAIAANISKQDAQRDMETLQASQQKVTSNEVSSGKFIPQSSMDVGDTKAATAGKHIDASRNSMMTDFLDVKGNDAPLTMGDNATKSGLFESNDDYDKTARDLQAKMDNDSGYISSDNVTDKEKAVMADRIDAQEANTMSHLGYDNKTNSFDSTGDTSARLAGVSRSDWDKITTSGNQTYRAQAISRLMTGMDSIAGKVDSDHADEALRATGKFFQSQGEHAGRNASGTDMKNGSMLGLGQAYIDMADSAVVKDASELPALDVDKEALSKINDAGQNWKKNAIVPLVDQVNEANGQTAGEVDKRSENNKGNYKKFEEDTTKAVNTGEEKLTGKVDQAKLNEGPVGANKLLAIGAGMEKDVPELLSIARQDFIDKMMKMGPLGSMMADALDADLRQSDVLNIQKPENILAGEKALTALTDMQMSGRDIAKAITSDESHAIMSKMQDGTATDEDKEKLVQDIQSKYQGDARAAVNDFDEKAALSRTATDDIKDNVHAQRAMMMMNDDKDLYTSAQVLKAGGLTDTQMDYRTDHFRTSLEDERDFRHEKRLGDYLERQGSFVAADVAVAKNLSESRSEFNDAKKAILDNSVMTNNFSDKQRATVEKFLSGDHSQAQAVTEILSDRGQFKDNAFNKETASYLVNNVMSARENYDGIQESMNLDHQSLKRAEYLAAFATTDDLTALERDGGSFSVSEMRQHTINKLSNENGGFSTYSGIRAYTLVNNHDQKSDKLDGNMRSNANPLVDLVRSAASGETYAEKMDQVVKEKEKVKEKA